MNTILPNAVGISAADQQRDVDTIRQTLTSAMSLEKVVRGTDLANTVKTDRDVADRVAGLSKAIKITAEQDNLFSIVATGSSPKVTRQVVQKLIDLFVEQNLSGDRAETSTSPEIPRSAIVGAAEAARRCRCQAHRFPEPLSRQPARHRLGSPIG